MPNDFDRELCVSEMGGKTEVSILGSGTSLSGRIACRSEVGDRQQTPLLSACDNRLPHLGAVGERRVLPMAGCSYPRRLRRAQTFPPTPKVAESPMPGWASYTGASIVSSCMRYQIPFRLFSNFYHLDGAELGSGCMASITEAT